MSLVTCHFTPGMATLQNPWLRLPFFSASIFSRVRLFSQNEASPPARGNHGSEWRASHSKRARRQFLHSRERPAAHAFLRVGLRAKIGRARMRATRREKKRDPR